jgi:hypothetical protein
MSFRVDRRTTRNGGEICARQVCARNLLRNLSYSFFIQHGFVDSIVGICLVCKSHDALARLSVRHQPAVGIGPAAAHFGDLRIRQSHVAHVLDIVEQRAGGGILLMFRQLFDLAQRLFEQFVMMPM